MALAVFDMIFHGQMKVGAVSDNASVSAAIVGVDTILTHAAREIFGTIVDPEVDVRHTPDRFEVDYGFRLNLGMLRRAALSADSRLCDPQPMLVIDALGLRAHDLGDPQEDTQDEGTLAGLFQLLIALAGRAIDRIDLLGETVDVKCGRDIYHVSYLTYRLLRDRAVRRGVAALARALTEPSLRQIAFVSRETGETILALDSRHILALSLLPEKDVLLIDEVRTMAVSLVGPNFRNDKTWTFTNGAQTIVATMHDAKFLNLVDNGLFSIRSGDVLIVNMRIVTRQGTKGLSSTYDVLKVVDLRWPKRHIAMPGV